jgi:tRNA pseudouridine38-40 synthase
MQQHPVPQGLLGWKAMEMKDAVDHVPQSAIGNPQSAMAHRNLRLELQYDGTDFHGWQIQSNLPTIQGTLTEAICFITGERVHVTASGRTDAGAHALAQVCNFPTESTIPASNLQKALNSVLCPAIRVMTIEQVPENFHSRYQARIKHYRYRLLQEGWCSPFDYRYVHHYPRPLDLETMSRAAERVVGSHDFSAFCDSDSEVESKVREVVSSFFVFDTRRNLIEYNICANGFLHHMVRNIVGTFLEVGKGSLGVETIKTILESRNRSNAGPTAPAKGLFLVSVSY